MRENNLGLIYISTAKSIRFTTERSARGVRRGSSLQALLKNLTTMAGPTQRRGRSRGTRIALLSTLVLPIRTFLEVYSVRYSLGLALSLQLSTPPFHLPLTLHTDPWIMVGCITKIIETALSISKVV